MAESKENNNIISNIDDIPIISSNKLISNDTILSSHDIKGIAEYIKSGKCKKIAILAGAGISVSAGIPDFRSKGGFYKTLNIKRDYAQICNMTKDQIKFCEMEETNILTLDLFKVNPACYCEARRPFIIAPMKYKATKTHWFFKTLYNKGLLKRFYSTNIDGLDIQCQFPNDILMHVHGTLGKAACIICEKPADMKWFRNEVYQRNYPIRCQYCNKPKNWVKPGTVLYGQSLPSKFYELKKADDLKDIDLMIIAGSSLSVYPSCSVPDSVGKKCVRLLLNKTKVGYNYHWNEDGYYDVWYNGNCDDACNELIKLLGWENDLIISMIGNVTNKANIKQQVIKKLHNNNNILSLYQKGLNGDMPAFIPNKPNTKSSNDCNQDNKNEQNNDNLDHLPNVD